MRLFMHIMNHLFVRLERMGGCRGGFVNEGGGKGKGGAEKLVWRDIGLYGVSCFWERCKGWVGMLLWKFWPILEFLHHRTVGF